MYSNLQAGTARTAADCTLRSVVDGESAGTNELGFTLIELLIVIVIMAVLGAIVVVGVSNYASAGASASCASDLKTTEMAVVAYRAQMGNYPDGSTTGGTGIRTDTDPVTIDAASTQSGAGSELLTGDEVGATGHDSSGASTPNLDGQGGSGAWLRDAPINAAHYYLWVANDGSGSVFVGTGTYSAADPAPTATDCSSVS
jgi:prepilin-type N-terminal cleavage/methylation domain-containing protein